MPSYTDWVQYEGNKVLLSHKRLWGWFCHHSFEWWIPKVLWRGCILLYSQRLTLTLDNAENGKRKSHVAEMRERIIKRAALEFRDGMYGILLTKCNESPSSKLRHTEQWLYIWCCKWRLSYTLMVKLPQGLQCSNETFKIILGDNHWPFCYCIQW